MKTLGKKILASLLLYSMFLFICFTAVSCSMGKVTAEDVNKQLEKAKEANLAAYEEMQKTVEMRKEFTVDYKEAKTKELSKKISNIDSQIRSISNQKKDASNEAVIGSLENAIDALQDERKKLSAELKTVEEIKVEDWNEYMQNVARANETLESEISKVENSMEGYSQNK